MITKPEIGEFVIVNDTDRPESRLIARIAHISEDGSLRLIYCNIAFEVMNGMSARYATRVSDFGCDVEVVEGYFRGVRTDKPSTATYEDGSHREWQGRN